MKILFVHHRYHSNLFNWFRGFRQNGHDVNLLVYKPDQVDQPDLPKSRYLEPSSWSVKKMKANSRTRGDGVDSFSPYYYPSFKTLYKYFQKEKPDLVVIRPVFSRFGYMTLFMSLWFGARIVFHSRIRIHRFYSKPKLLAFKLFLTLLNAYWMSPCKGDPLKYPLASKRLIYFPFLITSQIENREYFEDGMVNILCVAKYFSSKNPLMMLKVFLRLREQFDDIKLTICGTGSEVGDYYKEMVRLKQESEFDGDIQLFINQPLEKMADLYSSNDIFVLPTNHDPASFTVLEAMSYGLSTITTNVDGSSGYITHGENGFIIGKGKEGELLSCLTSLVENRELIKKHGTKSLSLVKANHHPVQISSTYISRLFA